MSEAVLEEKPKIKKEKEKEKPTVSGTGTDSQFAIATEEQRPKWVLLYFGDTIGQETLIKYVKGEVMGNPNHIDPSKQLVVFTVTTSDKSEDDKVDKTLQLITKEYGYIAGTKQLNVPYKNQSQAYLYCFNDPTMLEEIVKQMGEDIQFLCYTHDNSCFAGLADHFNIQQLETYFDKLNVDNKGKPSYPKRLVYENSQRDFIAETQKHFQSIQQLFNEKKDDIAIGLINNSIDIDLKNITFDKVRNTMNNYLKSRMEGFESLSIKAKLDDKTSFNVGQYKE